MASRKPRPRAANDSHPRNTVAPLQSILSDYDSEANYTTPAPAHPHAQTPRTNEALNLTVLQRYRSDIAHILSIAPSATIYTFDNAWERSGIEGTLFVCQLSSAGADSGRTEGFCVVILNRRALENLILDLRDVADVEIQDEYLILRVMVKGNADTKRQIDGSVATEGVAPGSLEKTLGVFIHADKEETRRVNNLIIKECWDKVKDASIPVANDDHSHFNEANQSLGLAEEQQAYQGFGRKVSITDLFGR